MVTLKETILNISLLRSQRLIEAQAVLKKAMNILVKKYHVKKIILIGSLADKDRFGFHSDIDLCVEGLSDNCYFEAIGKLLSEAGEFDIDIIPLENATPEMKRRIEKGILLYEKK